MKAIASIAGAAWLAALILAVWETLARFRVLDPLFFPPPSALAATFGSLMWSGEIARQVAHTLTRTAAGFGVGVVASAVLAAALSLSPALRRAAQPLIAALYSTPRLTLLPMVMLLFGVNNISRISLVALGTLLLMVIQIEDAVRAVNRDYVDMAVNYGATRSVVLRKVYLLACLPQIFTGLRLSFSRALVLTISVELLNCEDGIGSMIWNSWQTFAIEKLYVSVALAAALGFFFQWLFQRLEVRLVPWQERSA